MDIPLKNIKGVIVAYAKVDNDDYEILSKYKWHGVKRNNIYVCAQGYVNGKTVRMHHQICGKPGKGFVVDHINGNGLDNRKCNLRQATYKQNAQNSKNKKKYIGTIKDRGKYKARYSEYHLGIFETEEEAAKQYDIYVYLTLGKHAKTNNLITYEESLKYKVENLIKTRRSKYPKYIEKCGNKYCGTITYNKKRFRTKYYNEQIDAENELKIIKDQIDKLKKEEHYSQDIIYDENQNAVIPIFGGKFAIIDKDIWYEVMKHKWCESYYGYSHSKINNKTIKMHQFIS